MAKVDSKGQPEKPLGIEDDYADSIVDTEELK